MNKKILDMVQGTAQDFYNAGVMHDTTLREQGQKKPNGPSLKLLNLVAKKGLKILA
ncbi:hypothetical protein [Arsukibacterium perlucidum]|uniref:hypothetical protein n=1 Tax=Arsukibacterium perlucidum TaxID=368811 RepID=UPI000382C9EE|nr:hypothetical protein [Arsukibacterium perlucidum]